MSAHASRDEGGGAPNVKVDAVDDTELERAIQDSQREAVQQEGADIAEAVLRSKADAPELNCDGVIIFRLTRVSNEITEILLQSPLLVECRNRVVDAGCEVVPAYANGAKCFVPLTAEQVSEINLEPQPHHIIALRTDRDLIAGVLSNIPCRKRPQLRLDHRTEPPKDANHYQTVEVEDVDAEQVAIKDEYALSGLLIRNTFLHILDRKEVSESSAFCESAPCGTSDFTQPANPRRWGP